jgi:hypothetical protein
MVVKSSQSPLVTCTTKTSYTTLNRSTKIREGVIRRRRREIPGTCSIVPRLFGGTNPDGFSDVFSVAMGLRILSTSVSSLSTNSEI